MLVKKYNKIGLIAYNRNKECDKLVNEFNELLE